MPRGGLVDGSGKVINVFEANSILNTQYETDAQGNWLTFAPDPYCNIGDHWTGSVFIYAGTTAPSVTPTQVLASFTLAGFGPQLNSAISAASVANQNTWRPPLINAADPVIIAVAVTIPLTASQVNSLLMQASKM